MAIGAAARHDRAAAFDAWLGGMLPDRRGLALVAVGGLGRRECSPHGDLDLILLHAGLPGVDEVASSLWYPIWDKKIGLDHSTRTIAESLDAAHDDIKVAMGLLDARHIAGDRALSEQLARKGIDLWRRTAARQLGLLRELCEERHRVHGELAYLLEGDLKEAAGGLRDVSVLRAIGVAGIADALPPPVRAAASRLLDVRDALHLAVGRRSDRLRAQEREAVALALGLSDGDVLLRRIGLDARTVAWTLADCWRAVQRWRSRLRGGVATHVRRPVARDVVSLDGEIVLARTAIGPRPDPSLSLRVAAAAAQAQMPIARATLEWLKRFETHLEVPWPAPARQAFLALLGAGPGLVPTWEACDRFGLTGQWLPQWTRVRGTPQHHPVHQYTLDRHLVQAAANASRWAREVARPDLLVLGALLHDIGKGLPGDHSVVGAPIAASIARDIGLPDDDVRIIEDVVLHHLLLPDIATRRDLDDPAVIADVADRVKDVTTLEILHMLARADAAATGPAAWSSWKGRLIDTLVLRVLSLLGGDHFAFKADPSPALAAGAMPVIQVADDWVAIAAPDRVGLLAAVAGCLGTHKLEIAAVNSVTLGERAIIECAVSSRFGAPLDRERVAADLRRVALDQFVLPARFGLSSPSRKQPPKVIWIEPDLLELRASDAPGLLYRVTSALSRLGVGVRAARVSTLGADAVDAFYLTGSFDPEAVETAVLSAAS
ncbi:[protein-PII] uridylyltransferase [Allorhizocola rhizosphaerae]|uniref:[protein-PII] uridylyltransferase n=1 Tax=Allorhizocola rhizosphaerae TaxID=1872709 RepID=UPI001FE96491|nr:[protein-PII] uridylyltransferase [Allorhizocola rhizosphaerae]